jgi:alpha-galactosidase
MLPARSTCTWAGSAPRSTATSNGSVDFQIWADGTKVADSGVRTGSEGAVHLTGDLSGAKFLRMVLTDGGDGNSYDHSDWAAAQLTCS